MIHQAALLDVFEAAKDVLAEGNTALGFLERDGSVRSIEYVHVAGRDERCVECGVRWPCAMERLRRAIAQVEAL